MVSRTRLGACSGCQPQWQPHPSTTTIDLWSTSQVSRVKLLLLATFIQPLVLPLVVSSSSLLPHLSKPVCAEAHLFIFSGIPYEEPSPLNFVRPPHPHHPHISSQHFGRTLVYEINKSFSHGCILCLFLCVDSLLLSLGLTIKTYVYLHSCALQRTSVEKCNFDMAPYHVLQMVSQNAT